MEFSTADGDDGGVGVQNNDREWQQICLLRQVNKRENDIKKIKVQKEISKPLFNFELLRSEEECAENLSPHGQTVHMIRSPPESSKDDVRRHKRRTR